MDMQYENLE